MTDTCNFQRVAGLCKYRGLGHVVWWFCNRVGYGQEVDYETRRQRLRCFFGGGSSGIFDLGDVVWSFCSRVGYGREVD
jgi:hypothetical protein